MTVQDFILRYHYPPTLTSRTIKKAVLAGAKSSAKGSFRIDLPDWGLRASRSEGKTRIQYEIYAPERLRYELGRAAGWQLLSESSQRVVLEAAYEYFESVRHHPNLKKEGLAFVNQVQEALIRTGVIQLATGAQKRA